MSLLYSSNFGYQDGEFRKPQEFSDLGQYNYHQQQQPNLINSGLTRYRSAPSSFFENLVNGATDNQGGTGGAGYEDFRYMRPSSPDMDTLLARFISSSNGPVDPKSHDSKEFIGRPMKQEQEDTQMVYQNLPGHNLANDSSVNVESLDSPFRVMNSMGLENSIQATKMSTGKGSDLIRQNSSPAGIFSNLGVDNGFAVVRDLGSFRACSGSKGETSPSTSRLSNHVNFSTGQRNLPQIAELGCEEIGGTGLDGNGNKRQYIPDFTNDSWDDNSSNDFKRARDNDGNIFSALNTLDNQNANTRNRVTGLTQHLSLPKTFAEMATAEKFLRFQDSVPCKIRAKRGCATHPRSIAERVRRTRISERMRKLQELFPNMDKQTNTADMLDLAVEHIKELQKQVKNLTDTRANCTCSGKRKEYPNASV